MSAAVELLRRVEALGVSVRVDPDGEHLRLKPATALTPELLEELRACKAELLALLTPRPAWSGSWYGWSCAYRHELSRLLAEGRDFDSAEEAALASLPDPPPVSAGVH